MSIQILIFIFIVLLIHWFADFVLQTEWQATNKSIRNNALVRHTLTYTAFWGLALLFAPIVVSKIELFGVLIFCSITFICHTIQDYYTSRWVKKSVMKDDWHNMFVKIGIDQVGHYVQLFLTFYLLMK